MSDVWRNIDSCQAARPHKEVERETKVSVKETKAVGVSDKISWSPTGGFRVAGSVILGMSWEHLGMDQMSPPPPLKNGILRINGFLKKQKPTDFPTSEEIPGRRESEAGVWELPDLAKPERGG